MAESFVRLPDDSALTGKRFRTCTFTVEGQTVHARYDVLIDDAGTKLVHATADPATNAAAMPVRVIAPATPAAVTVSGTPTASITNFPATFGVSNFPGSFNVGNFPGGFNVNNNVTLAAGTNGVGSVVVSSGTVSASIIGTVPVSAAFWETSNAATTGNVSASTTSVALVASNANRHGLALVNDSTSALYVKFGTAASVTSFTFKLEAGQLYEMPNPIYSGVIHGVWSVANGAARVTELT